MHRFPFPDPGKCRTEVRFSLPGRALPPVLAGIRAGKSDRSHLPMHRHSGIERRLVAVIERRLLTVAGAAHVAETRPRVSRLTDRRTWVGHQNPAIIRPCDKHKTGAACPFAPATRAHENCGTIGTSILSIYKPGLCMNEQVARDVVLVRAIETVDRKHEILTDDDRKYASRSAKELASWQAADSKSAVTADHFLQQRRSRSCGGWPSVRRRFPPFSTAAPAGRPCRSACRWPRWSSAPLPTASAIRTASTCCRPLCSPSSAGTCWSTLCCWPGCSCRAGTLAGPGRQRCAASAPAAPRCRASCRRPSPPGWWNS